MSKLHDAIRKHLATGAAFTARELSWVCVGQIRREDLAVVKALQELVESGEVARVGDDEYRIVRQSRPQQRGLF